MDIHNADISCRQGACPEAKKAYRLDRVDSTTSLHATTCEVCQGILRRTYGHNPSFKASWL